MENKTMKHESKITVEDLDTAMLNDSLVFITNYRGDVIDEQKPLTATEQQALKVVSSDATPVEYVAKCKDSAESEYETVIAFAYQLGLDDHPYDEMVENGEIEMDACTDRLYDAIKNVVNERFLPLVEKAMGKNVESMRCYLGFCSTGESEGDHEVILTVPYASAADTSLLTAVRSMMFSFLERFNAFVEKEFTRLSKMSEVVRH